MAEHSTFNRVVDGFKSLHAHSLLLFGRKEVKIILLINKTEAFAMRKLVGNENVKKTYSGHSKYYLVESYQNLKALSNYRKSKIVG